MPILLIKFYTVVRFPQKGTMRTNVLNNFLFQHAPRFGSVMLIFVIYKQYWSLHIFADESLLLELDCVRPGCRVQEGGGIARAWGAYLEGVEMHHSFDEVVWDRGEAARPKTGLFFNF